VLAHELATAECTRLSAASDGRSHDYIPPYAPVRTKLLPVTVTVLLHRSFYRDGVTTQVLLGKQF
jgi:hypothetical protein